LPLKGRRRGEGFLMTLRELSDRTQRLRTLLLATQPESFRTAFRFALSAGLAFMVGMYFAHRFHEADRRIDEMRVLREVGDRMAKELDLRLLGSATALQNFVVRYEPRSPRVAHPEHRVDMRLPAGVTALWVGSWPSGAPAPIWLHSWENVTQSQGLLYRSDRSVRPPEGSPVEWLSTLTSVSCYRIQMESKAGVGWFLSPWGGSSRDSPSGVRNFVMARVQADFLSLADFSREWGARGTSRVSFKIVPKAAHSQSREITVQSKLASSDDIVLELSFRGDSIWLTQVEIEKNAFWLIIFVVTVLGCVEFARAALLPRFLPVISKRLRRWLPGSAMRSFLAGSSREGTESLASPGAQVPARGALSVAPPARRDLDSVTPRVERKEVAILYGRLIEPESWVLQPKIAAQEVADTVFEVLGAIKDSLSQENLHPELRMTEEGTFTAFFEVWSEGSGGFKAPLQAILSIRRALLRVNGLRKTDGHREVRVCMGLRTGMMVRDSRHLPIRYIGAAYREAQDLARASGTLGVDCLISPMGDEQRGEPLDQLMQDFVVKRVGEGKFKVNASPQGAGALVPVYVVEGVWVQNEAGERSDRLQIEGLYYSPLRANESSTTTESALLYSTFELETDLLTRNNIIPFERKAEAQTASDSLPEKPVPKSEAS